MNDLVNARKQRFLDLKAKAGGAENLIAETQGNLWKVYFDDSGEIMCFSNNPDLEIEKTWKTYPFTQEQLQILHSKDLSQYRVHIHPLIDNKYSIEPVKEEAHPTALATSFLSQVKPEAYAADVYCEITKNTFKVWVDNKIKSQYSHVDPDTAVRKGMSAMRFYITAPNDPHILLNKVTVRLSELLKQEHVEKTLDDDYQQCSIYTKQLFDKYARRGIISGQN